MQISFVAELLATVCGATHSTVCIMHHVIVCSCLCLFLKCRSKFSYNTHSAQYRAEKELNRLHHCQHHRSARTDNNNNNSKIALKNNMSIHRMNAAAEHAFISVCSSFIAVAVFWFFLFFADYDIGGITYQSSYTIRDIGILRV